MVVALLRIIHTGIQDERLLPQKGNPVTRFFEKVFLKAGRFTTQWSRLDFDTIPTFGSSATITLPREGHLITRLYLVTTMPDIAGPQLLAQKVAGFVGPTYGWTNSLGHALINTATIDIGGARVEQITGQMLEVLDEFQTPLEKVTSVNNLIQRYDNGFNSTSIGFAQRPTVVTTPLPFWFSKGDPGVALPIDAINSDAVRLTVTFAPLNSLYVCSNQVDLSKVKTDVAGQAYMPLVGATFYKTGSTPVYGIGNVDAIPGITIPTLTLGDTYIMAEYVYLDKPEANKFRISDIQYPIVQHYAIDPHDSYGQPKMTVLLRIPNPCRDLYFFAQRYEAPWYNAPFLATRDLSGFDCKTAPWWPDASGLNALTLGELVPAFSYRESEPLQQVGLIYEGKLIRYSNTPSVFRSLIPSYEQRKSPWVNRYYYNMTFGLQNGFTPPSIVTGEANLDKIERLELQIDFAPFRGSLNPTNVPRYRVFVFAETYSILRIYGGRAGILFGY